MKYILILAVFGLCACTDPDNASRILADNGYTNVYLTGYNAFACSKDDTYHTGFEATSPNGRHVKGTVCAGVFFKNSTIRFE